MNEEELTTDYICGVPYGAVPFATLLSLELNIPMIMPRSEKKNHGTANKIPGFNDSMINKNIIIIEDVVTTGGSVDELITSLIEYGFNVIAVFSFVNRASKEYFDTTYKSFNKQIRMLIPYNYLITLDEIKEFHGKMSYKKTFKQFVENNGNLCVAADMNDKNKIINLIDDIGSSIAVLKLHYDTIIDFNDDFINLLLNLKKKYNFLIWEDRKFADIGSIVDKQIKNDHFSKWVDIFSIHKTVSPSICDENNQFKYIFINDMSNGHDMCPNIGLKEYYFSSPNIVGAVTQSNEENINIVTPGISLTCDNDKFDQKYTKISDHKNCLLFVIGRAIYNSDDISKTLGLIRRKIALLKIEK